MARLKSDRGYLLIDFHFRGYRCREYLGLSDDRETRRIGRNIVHEIQLELATGKFDYAARFPESKKLVTLGLKRASVKESTSLGDFALEWLVERRSQLTPATAYDYDRLLRTHLLPSA